MNLQEKWQLKMRQKEATRGILKPKSVSPAENTHYFQCNLLLGRRVEEEHRRNRNGGRLSMS